MPSVLLSSSEYSKSNTGLTDIRVFGGCFPWLWGESLSLWPPASRDPPPFLACGFFLHLQSQQPSTSSSLLPRSPSLFLSVSLSFPSITTSLLLLWSSWLPYIRTPSDTGSTQWIHLDSSGSFPHLRIYLVASVSPLAMWGDTFIGSEGEEADCFGRGVWTVFCPLLSFAGEG